MQLGPARGVALDSQNCSMQFGSTRGMALYSRGAALDSQDLSMRFGSTRGAALDSQDSSLQFVPKHKASPPTGRAHKPSPPTALQG